MTLLAPDRLWLLAIVVALGLAYATLQRRRRHHGVRHPRVALVAAVAPRRAGWRRHLTAGALLLSVVALVGGLARPAESAVVPRKEAVVMLAVDISASMSATDVAPSRLAAAVTAARHFVDAAPDAYRIGLVSFDVAGHTLVNPTTDHGAVVRALDRLRPIRGTAAGEGLYTALDVIHATTVADGVVIADDKPYAAVVLLTDGANTVGRSLPAAARAAAHQKVPVFTIAYGTDGGVARVNGKTVPVPADPGAMEAVARISGGKSYTAVTAAQLTGVYDQISSHIGHVTEQVELTVVLAAVAAAALTFGLGTSMLWSPRLI